MKIRDLLWLSLGTVAAMLTIAAIVGARLPADAQLPIHWGLDGTPDGFAGKWMALCLPAGAVAFNAALVAFASRAEPRQGNQARSEGVLRVTWFGLLGLFWVIELMLVAVTLGWDVPMTRVMLGTTGLLFVALGNQLGKSRSMYMVGIRTPWTLADDDVWIATHRLAGKLMVGAGILCVLMAAIGLPTGIAMAIGFALILAAAIVPVIYSYGLWRSLGRPAPGDGRDR